MESKQLIEIKEQDILGHYKNVYGTLSEFNFSCSPDKTSSQSLRRNTVAGISPIGLQEQKTTVKLLKTIENIDSSNPLMTNKQHHIITSLQRGMAIATTLVELFGKQTGLDRMQEANARGILESAERVKFQELMHTASYIASLTVANFMTHVIGSNVNISQIEADDIKNLKLKSPLETIKSVLFDYDSCIRAQVRDDETLVTITFSFFDKLINELMTCKEGLRHTEGFANYIYSVKKDEFEVNGFERAILLKKSKVVMSFKKPEEVIGNAIAKHQSQRLAKMLMCYDFKKQMNPFAELGGFIFTFMGDGNPGTGKTTLIQMIAGELSKYCEIANYPFYYENFGPDQISSYQGQSGQNAKQFIKNILNPNIIAFGTIDDIDQVAGKRGDKQSSSGQQEVTAVLMESFAGATTRVLGNCSFGMFSNYPENVDDALRQRASARFLIDGPTTYEDYVDILALLLGKNHKIGKGNVTLFETQQIKSAVKKGYEKHNLPQEKQLLDIYNKTIASVGPLQTFETIGRYLKNIQETEPRFTGRAIKNITDAAKVRSMDFDMPDEWFENPSVFLHKTYEEKKEMIQGLIEPITAETFLQEINRYADSEFRYASKSDDAEVNKMTREIKLRQKALTQAAE